MMSGRKDGSGMTVTSPGYTGRFEDNGKEQSGLHVVMFGVIAKSGR